MKNFKNIYHKGAGSVCCGIAAALMALPVFTSCEDFFNQESDDVLYADQDHLNNAEDSIYSVIGVMTKLQSIADRTILLGELRGDLIKLTEVANNDLREIANFNVSDDNAYNNPSDYYAIINNCNYFIAKADTALRSNRDELIFMKEFAAIKAIRAWTYLQLAINYGKVPFYTEPLLSKEAAEAAEDPSQKRDITYICDYFINDLASIPERYNREYPSYRKIRGVESQLLYFPLDIVRGDLYLWKAAFSNDPNDYKKAAEHYYRYISERNGTNSAYPMTMEDRCYWRAGSATWLSPSGMIFPVSEYYDDESELITMIAGDSIRAEGHYSELRNFFTSREENDYKVSINPSARLIELSAAQKNCVLSASGTSMSYAPKGLSDYMSGDLRLQDCYRESWTRDRASGNRIETQYIYKYSSQRNVHIYRRTMVYLRLAEALNAAGYPRMAFEILSEGLSNEVIDTKVIHYADSAKTLAVSLADSTFLAKFNFSDVRYGIIDAMEYASGTPSDRTHNMIGIHARGCGYTPMDTTYVLPYDTVVELDVTKRAQIVKEQQEFVDSLILNESALEFAFEGTRYYDIMRYALRSKNPEATMQKIIGIRKGEKNAETIPALSSRTSWFLNWKGKLGM